MDSIEEKTGSLSSDFDGIRCRLLVLCKVALSAFDLFIHVVMYQFVPVVIFFDIINGRPL